VVSLLVPRHGSGSVASPEWLNNVLLVCWGLARKMAAFRRRSTSAVTPN